MMATFMQEDEEPLSEYELLQLKNEKILNELVNKELKNIEEIDELKSYQLNSPKRKPRVKPESRRHDSAFRFFGNVPTERRSSSRLAKIAPVFNIENATAEIEKLERPRARPIPQKSASKTVAKPFQFVNPYEEKSRSNLLDDLTEPIILTKRKDTGDLTKPPTAIPVEMLDDEYLNCIASLDSKKVYSEKGSLCHHCRQKTIDSKTVCRSGSCQGSRGQFCGHCLLKFYNENAATALQDPKWSCPPCRDICKCSICIFKMEKKKVLQRSTSVPNE